MKTLGYFSFILLISTSCSDISSPSNSKDTISALLNDTHKLGDAYRSDIKKILPNSCITQTPALRGNTKSYTKIEKNLSMDKILEELNISSEVSAKVQYVDIKASLKVARSHSANELEESYTLLWKGDYPTQIAEGITWSEFGKRHLPGGQDAAGKENFAQFCGDEFVYRVNRAAWMMATLKLQFSSLEDKASVSAGLQASLSNVLGGEPVAGVKNEISKIDESLQKRIKVSVEISQMGGDPASSLAAAKGIQCDLSTPDKCLNEIVNLPAYLADLKESLKNEKYISVYSFETMPYATILEEAPSEPLPAADSLNAAINKVWLQLKNNIVVKQNASGGHPASLLDQVEVNIKALVDIRDRLVSCIEKACASADSLIAEADGAVITHKAPDVKPDGMDRQCISMQSRVTLKSVENDNYISYNENYESYSAESRLNPSKFSLIGDGVTLTNNSQVLLHEGLDRGLSYYGGARGGYSWGLTYYPQAEKVQIIDANSHSDGGCIKNNSEVFLKIGDYYVRTWQSGDWKGYLFAWDSDPRNPSYDSHKFVISVVD
ncbi:hypothetical protein [Oligoflexus tunisiensis]|uniref:hypothetical protein n=1 Tax=Oligoflexus tunisiensis TaxID=708132 RepID=UPI00114D325E|nr:hypothetical protein [Oligoflexus tunisiensis]